jgi:hypothetical protein
MPEKVTFSCSFPPIQSAIKISGNGDGMRIMIDIPESEMGEAVKLMLYRQVPLKVTVEPYEQEKPETTNGTGTAGGRTLKRSTAKKRV